MGIGAATRNILQKVGWAPKPESRTVVVSVPDLDACAGLDSLVADMHHRHDRLAFRFIPGTPGAGDWLAARFPGCVLQPPLNNRMSAVAFLLTSRARLLLGIGHLGSAPAQVVKAAYRHGIAMAVVDARSPDAPGLSEGLRRRATASASLVDWWEARDAETAARLKALGIPEHRVSEPRATAAGDPDARLKPLDGLMARRPPNRRLLQRMVAAGLDHPTWRRVVGLRARRIESLEGLKAALGSPETILCLGNGPSSEDPAAVQMSHDCLFRVNHRWLGRGVLCRPDMVFTGQKWTLFTLRGTIFALQTRRAEAQLVTHQVFNPLCRRMRFVTLERLGVLGSHDWDGLRPTNGATMIAAAVALQPRRLVIAGIDLFSDPLGAYPGDDKTPNSYVLVHDSDLERQFIMQTLARHDGELVIVGKVLEEHWRAYAQTRQPQCAARRTRAHQSSRSQR